MADNQDIFDFQAWLDTVANHFMAFDFQALSETVALPAIVSTEKGPSVLSTMEEWKERFDFWTKLIEGHQATDMIRTARSSDRIEPEVFRGRYETELVRGGTRIIDPFMTEIILRRQNNVWRVIFLEHSLTKQFWKTSF